MDSIFDGSDVVEKIVNPLLATTASLPPRKKGKGPLGKSAFPGPVRAVKRKETAPPGTFFKAGAPPREGEQPRSVLSTVP